MYESINKIGGYPLIAVLYLMICFVTGCMICTFAFPKLKEITAKSFRGNPIELNQYFVLLPAWLISGTILVTWLVYLLALIFRDKPQPLIFANGIVMSVCLVISALYLIQRFWSKKVLKMAESANSDRKISLKTSEWIFLAFVVFLSIQLMWQTFFIAHGQIYVGNSVFSDFSPHIGMIRSFSHGNNFPTTYSHFAGSDIRYHFMFQFLVGNLEFLGMRLDYAFNVPSAIGMISTFSLLYILGCKLGGKRAIGFLSCLFFAFRSSPSLFKYLSELPKGTGILKALNANSSFFSYSTHEDWGLWNLNVYCNQRHFAFTLPIMLLMLLIFLPLAYEGLYRTSGGMNIASNNKRKKQSIKTLFRKGIEFLKLLFFQSEGWKVKNIKLAIMAGLIIGALAFWNGAVTIGILLVLFVLAIVSDRRLELLITAVIAVILSVIQSKVFISGSAIETKFLFGFIAENPTFFGSLDYISRLTGILFPILLLSFLSLRGTRRWVLFAFLAPFIFAFTVSLTIDVTVNHKYVMMSLMLLGIFVAIFLVKLFENRSFFLKVVSGILVIVLTCTGFYEYLIVLKKNSGSNFMVLNMEDKVTEWVMDHTTAKDIILSPYYALNQVVLGGGMLYLGWPYFGWSAGYDTDGRQAMVTRMYQADTKEELSSLVEQENIRYIIVDYDARTSDLYNVNEENIRNTYQAVFKTGEGEWNTTIYDTTQKLAQ